MIMENNPFKGAIAQAGIRSAVDQRFWDAYDEWKAVIDAGDADTDESDEAADRWNKKETPLFDKMILMPVTTASAILAKYSASGGHDINLPDPAKSTLTMIKWDLERLAKQEIEQSEPNAFATTRAESTRISRSESEYKMSCTLGDILADIDDISSLLYAMSDQLEEMMRWTSGEGIAPEETMNTRAHLVHRLTHLALRGCGEVEQRAKPLA